MVNLMLTTESNRLHERTWADFGKKLLETKAGRVQKEFLDICLSGKDGFMQYLHEHLLATAGNVLDGGIADIEHDFSEREFLFLPKSTQQVIWNTFRNEPFARMHSCGCWGYQVIRLVETGRIEARHLAANPEGEFETGHFAIETAFNAPAEKMDSCVRRILRSMCNPAPRGMRVVFKDFAISKSYWRWHWTARMHQHIGLGFDQILDIFDGACYAELSEKMHSSESHLESGNVLGGMLLFLFAEQQAGRPVTSRHIRSIVDNIGGESVWKKLETQDPQTNQTEIANIAKSLPK